MSEPATAAQTAESDPLTLNRRALVERVHEVSRQLGGRRVTRKEFEQRTRTPSYQIIRHFGSFSALLEQAGLQPYCANARVSDEVLLRALRDACLAKGCVVSRDQFVKAGLRGAGPYRRRWRNWPAALAALRDWVETHDPDFPYRADLPSQDDTPPPPPPRLPPERRYGAPLNYPGFLHEPVNEQGVVLLFGAVARELGFAIERASDAFPDCEAKRRRGDVWERVRIEFEFASRNFQVHRHDPARCDLIVCWEDNWPEARLEVIALKTELARLSSLRDP
ncbi:MAG: hypothetical protein FJX55_05045 [Alphaproteobacteria bacterium]|nr:hypothetical protein [Alphaproteobacteria bacterium]